MKHSHCYISLTVDESLSDLDISKWLKTIEVMSPTGTMANANIIVDGHQKSSRIYLVKSKNKLVYVVPLSRDLMDNEASKIAIAWDKCWPNKDFEIRYSQIESGLRRKRESADTVLDQIAEDMAKKLHSDWVKEKVDQHWNYGPRYNTLHKQHPMLLPWEQLPKKQKLAEIERARKSLDILDSINLKISLK